MGFFNLWKKRETKPLPKYQGITIDNIPSASALLFYGGNRLTEMAGNGIYAHPYCPPAFHAALFLGMGDGLFLNVGKFRTIEELRTEFRSGRRIDVIVYKELRDADRVDVVAESVRDVSRPHAGFSLPDYGITDYLRFGLKWFRPSKKEICSENVALSLGRIDPNSAQKFRSYGDYVASANERGGIVVSENIPVDTAPWDLLEWAEKNPTKAEIFTAWDDMKK